MCRWQCHLRRNHWRQRDQFNLERFQRKLLECDFSDIELYTKYCKWHSHLDADHERSGWSMSGSNRNRSHYSECGSYSQCGRYSNSMCSGYCNISGKHRRWRNQFNLERGNRNFL